MFGGRALALDNRLFELMEGKNIINVSAKRFFFRGVCRVLGGLSGGYISTIDLSKHRLIIPMESSLHIVMFAAAFIRLMVWFYLVFFLKKAF